MLYLCEQNCVSFIAVQSNKS